MATTKLADGVVLSITAPATVTAGAPVAVGDLVGIALAAAASGDPVNIDTEGVYRVAKATGAVTVGQKLYVSGAQLTTTAGSNAFAGVATAAAASSDATVDVLLNKGA